jgi:hypothetical protein
MDNQEFRRHPAHQKHARHTMAVQAFDALTHQEKTPLAPITGAERRHRSAVPPGFADFPLFAAVDRGKQPYLKRIRLKTISASIRTKETLFQKITGLRSISGGRVLLRKSRFGWCRS